MLFRSFQPKLITNMIITTSHWTIQIFHELTARRRKDLSHNNISSTLRTERRSKNTKIAKSLNLFQAKLRLQRSRGRLDLEGRGYGLELSKLEERKQNPDLPQAEIDERSLIRNEEGFISKKSFLYKSANRANEQQNSNITSLSIAISSGTKNRTDFLVRTLCNITPPTTNTHKKILWDQLNLTNHFSNAGIKDEHNVSPTKPRRRVRDINLARTHTRKLLEAPGQRRQCACATNPGFANPSGNLTIVKKLA